MENVYWKLPLAIEFWYDMPLYFGGGKKHPQKWDLAKFQIHKDRENIKWNAIENKKVKVISALMTDLFFSFFLFFS